MHVIREHVNLLAVSDVRLSYGQAPLAVGGALHFQLCTDVCTNLDWRSTIFSEFVVERLRWARHRMHSLRSCRAMALLYRQVVFVLLAMDVCMHGGTASSIGESGVFDGNKQTETKPTSPQMTVSPLCPANQDYLRIEASDNARKALTGWLARDTARLVFIYFDLVVGNRTYHPGSCPDDGLSAIDAQTPLAWVLTSGGPNGGGLGSHSFAHAYLTLPVSYPRIYSLGILGNQFVGRLHHEVYRMKVFVDNSSTSQIDKESCWNKLDKTEKSSIMLNVVQLFVSDLDADGSTNTTSWNFCYSDPIANSEHLPYSTSPLVPHTPAYVCKDESGSMQRLQRDPYLKGLFAVFIGLSLGTLVVQFYILSKGLEYLRVWGSNVESPLWADNRGRTFNKKGFFNKLHLPVHVTIGGLLSSDIVFGPRAFRRLKWIVLWGICCLLYAIWPNILVQMILIPTSPIARLGVSSSETFGEKLPCKQLASRSANHQFPYISTSFYCVCGPVFAILSFLAVALYLPKSSGVPEILSLVSKSFTYPLASILLNVTAYLRMVVLFPLGRPDLVENYSDSETKPTRLLTRCLVVTGTFLLAQLIFWVPFLISAGVALFLCLIGTVACGATGIIQTFDSPHEKGQVFIIAWIPLSALAVVFYIQGSELLMFIILSSVSLYITYPLQTFLILSWSLALIVETQNLLQDYRSPLLAVQKKFVNKVKTLSTGYVRLDKNEDNSIKAFRLCLEKVSKDGDNIDWKIFFRKAEHIWNRVSLGLLTCINGSEHTFDSGTSMVELYFVRGALSWLDLRKDKVRNKNPVLAKLQEVLWMRFFSLLCKLVLLVFLFLSLIMLLLAFNSLWKDPSPKDTNSLLLTIVVVPLYTFVRTKLKSSSLTDDQQLMFESMLEEELDACFNGLVSRVSKPYKHVCIGACTNTS